MPSIFDELSAKYGLRLDPPTESMRQVRPPAPLRPAPELRDGLVLLHRHLSQVGDSIHHRISEMENRMSQALDNLTAQLGNLNQAVDAATAELGSLAAVVAAGSSGVSEGDVQAAADQVSTLVGNLNQAVSSASAAVPAPVQAVPQGG